jgi:hypothetical protein
MSQDVAHQQQPQQAKYSEAKNVFFFHLNRILLQNYEKNFVYL